MELNKIQSSGSWGKAADDLNQNFSKVNNAVEQVKNATTRNKGYFSSDTELKSAYPSANVGDIAYVGSAYPYQTWAWDGSAWKKKNDAGGEESVNLGDYYTKVETDEKLSELGSYESISEYIRAYTDAEDRFLWGIKHDGSIEFAKGIPTPIKNYIVEYVINRIDNVIIPEIETLKEAHEQYLKESESPEWARVIVDAEGKVLWGIRQDGSVEFTKGVPTSIKAYIDSLDRNNDEEVERINQLVIGLTDTFHYISNAEWVCAIVDAEERVLMGIKTDGSYYIPNREMYHVESNPEYAKAVVDTDGRVVFGIKSDGSCYIPKGISEGAKKGLLELTARISWFESEDNPEWLQVTTDSEGKVLEGIGVDGKKYFSKQEMFEKYNDVEGRIEMTIDSEGKVVSYRDSKGTMHEHKMNVKDSLMLGDKAMNDLIESIKKNGGIGENENTWSENVIVPIPRTIATVNLLTPSMPTTKTADIQGHLEYSDRDGNYFKIPIVLNAQGDSSMGFSKYVNIGGKTLDVGKNLSIDIMNEDFTDDGVKIKFGDWVPQDSFHIKKFYHDVFRGQCVVGYHLIEQMYQTRKYNEYRPWSYLYKNEDIYNSNGKLSKDFDNGAMGHPDGFPIEMYWNGSFIGIYAWCLKKHRDNYNCKKDDANAIILDGLLSDSSIFNGIVNWGSFELRNPKTLYCMDGSKYDGDNPKELIDSSSEFYNPQNEDHVVSSVAKDNIKRLSGAKAAINSNKTKETIEQYINIPFFIDYYLFGNIVYHHDGFAKNWIWCTWDGNIWSPMVYDADSIFGSAAWTGNNFIIRGSESGIMPGAFTDLLRGIYLEDMKLRYKELRDKGIFSVYNIVGLLRDWIEQIGYSVLDKELSVFSDCPSYRDSKINEGWEFLGLSDLSLDSYNESVVYNNGNKCNYGKGNYKYSFSATKDNVRVAPLSGFYNSNPLAMGYYNSIQRVENWLKERIRYLDSYFNYNINN